mgnify:CR=1 FL=1
MNGFMTKFSGWLLLFMLAMILFEIMAVGVFAAGWCLHSIFGHWAILVVIGAAALFAWIHHRNELAMRRNAQPNQGDFLAH